MHHKVEVELLVEHRVLQFAKQQFLQLYKANDEASHIKKVILATYHSFNNGNDEQTKRMSAALAHATFSDEFVIYNENSTLYIVGMTPRAALFGVYHYFELNYGLAWAIPGRIPSVMDVTDHKNALQRTHYAPLIERRGFVVETIDDLNFIVPLVDWLAKNKVNELFLTFTLWDKIGSHIEEMLLDRGIELTLGGHSTSLFLKHLQPKQTADHPYTAKKQLDYTDISWQGVLIDKIVAYCEPIKPLTRVSLWPEDIKHQSSQHFLQHYIQFTERLREGLIGNGLQLEVEHIAYNAGLSWDMLERENQKLSSTIDTLFAYWGRDYSTHFERAKDESDRRGYAALLDWTKQLKDNNNKITVFEYYSDHFMLSPLFPMLAKRIEHDIAHYSSLGIDGITNLIVPCSVEHYDYQWNQYFNSFVFARLLWGEQLDAIVHAYVCHFPQSLQAIFKEWVIDCEKELAKLTSWNVPLFPARAVDPLKVSSCSKEDKQVILCQLERVIELAQFYLEKPETSYSLPFYEALLHYKHYAKQVRAQWMAFTN